MWLTILAAAALTSTPAVGLTVSNQLGSVVTPPQSYLDDIEGEFVAAGLPVRRLKLECAGREGCLAREARGAGVPAVVGVSFAYGKKGVTLDLEAVRAEDNAVLSQLTFSTGNRLSAGDREALRRFARPIIDALAPRVADAPVAEPSVEPATAQLQPAPAAPPLVVEGAPTVKPTRSRTPAYVLGGGAIAAGIVAGIFLGLATSAESTLRSTSDPSPLTRAAAQQLVDGANRDYTVALGAGVGAGALATAAIIWLATE